MIPQHGDQFGERFAHIPHVAFAGGKDSLSFERVAPGAFRLQQLHCELKSRERLPQLVRHHPVKAFKLTRMPSDGFSVSRYKRVDCRLQKNVDR